MSSAPSETRLEAELRERLHTKSVAKLTASVSGACISKGHCFATDQGQTVFVKTNATPNAPVMFCGELESLRAIRATKTIRVPEPLVLMHNYDNKQTSAIVMEFLDIRPLSSKGCAKLLGEHLAQLHVYNSKVIEFNKRAARWIGKRPPSVRHILEARKETSATDATDEGEIQIGKHSMRANRIAEPAEQRQQFAERFIPEPDTEAAEQFGFHVATSCGAIPQVNEWTDDWVSFYARHRLDKVIRSLLSDHSDRELNERWSFLQLKVHRFFAEFGGGADDAAAKRIVPALLHGDLWSGNAAELSADTETAPPTPVVYDPSSFYGHSEYDFGIVRMFGGFPKEFEAAYFDALPKRKNFEKRNKLYQLFHQLNHWDHFGAGYRQSSLDLMALLNSIA